MRDLFAVIGATLSLAMLGLFALATALMASAASRHRREERQQTAILARRRAASDALRLAENEAVRAWHAAQRGRIHHPMHHPVSYATIDELMPRVVQEASHLDR